MKRTGLIFAAAAVLACAAYAGPQYIPLEVNNGVTTNAAMTDTKNPIGYIDEILIQGPTTNGIAVGSGTVTSVVTVVVSPNVGSSMTSTVLYTNATLTASAKARPRIAPTDTAGSALTSLTVYERFLCNGDPVTLTVTEVSNVTNVVHKVWLKIDN